MDNVAFAADGVAPAAAVFVVAEGADPAIAVEAGPLGFAGPPATRVPMAQRPINSQQRRNVYRTHNRAHSLREEIKFWPVTASFSSDARAYRLEGR